MINVAKKYGLRVLKALTSVFGQTIVPEYQTWIYQRNNFVQILDIDFAIDAGANIGQWATEFRKISSANIVSFEPDQRCRGVLDALVDKDPNWEVRYVALGEQNTTEEMNLWDVDGGSSSLKELTNFGEVFTSWQNIQMQKQSVPVRRLDKELNASYLEGHRVLLKIDTQGFEFEVLAGASEIISSFSMIEIELPLIEIYKGSRNTGDMISFIEKMGFTLVSVSTERWAFPGAADCDALFIRSEEYEYLKSHSKISES